jgi:DNA polymerase delta subunit 2
MGRSSNIEKYIVKVGSMDSRPGIGNFSSSEDKIFIEDENGRLTVDTSHLDTDWSDLVTGIVVGIRGVIKEDATLQALELFFPKASPFKSILQFKDEYICFVSGLEIGKPNFNHTLFNTLTDYFLGNFSDDDPVVGKIARLVILGDSIFKPLAARTVDRRAVGESELKGFQEMSSSLKQLDTLVSELSGMFPVDLVPGELDPTNASWPQQPLSPYLFPKSSYYGALQSVPNPYEFELDGVSFLCTSGQNISALSQFLPPEKSEIQIMNLTLKAKHLVPNAPDALQCIPMQQNDPFIIGKLPHCYLAGNTKEFRTAFSDERVRLICVPKFSVSKSIVLVHRFSLEPFEFFFEEKYD